MGSLSATHWIIIALVFLVLFGAKRLPDAARGLGRSLRIFKSEMSEMQSEGDKDKTTQAQAPAPELPAAQQPGTPVQQPKSDLNKA
ncbi:Sec-independent protein translocase subunit TatA [Nocardia otitidiscaviarum]|uniref:Sec-independent protein translocase protein TatA n=1 Tax=Nocardia otitidiscaviarum TaxID=1823 RepID=A0A379JLA8_9NOCA|nr:MULTISPECIES: Sec-independent protein translocase subunit TatA [Nocardia]MBF6136550.1 Sec-independent protein translocase subunit TatA [Nocardia otitidiscaviarum]MBF6180462.1 Sec-independent protein translocase subunit TatA [Nocardia otitidiscaviarum]MBF6240412.1 Sec-independent protein translocase subunit TatA [Nocardia otitidiscaviarum]MBF6484752.1 Sec-independent protein translocase subunit TatA [Nocardia otitidiscaviarum]MCP9618615.1 Sec-independent protein translocase subunit TatA [Noc